MGQTNSEPLQPRSLLAKNWLPLEHDPNVLVHRITQEQLQRHYIRILVKDLARETALFSTRMTSHQPHICRLLYFHPANTQQRGTLDHEKDFREMHIYTDRIAALRAWRREKVVAALQGLRRLIGIHGPIKITQRMISENQVGEVRVWISENPVNNHPDSKYMSEEQSMGDFAAILTKKNMELANLLMGCITLKEAYERLNKYREEHSPHQNYSHRASGSGDFKKRLDLKDRNGATYTNVFGQVLETMKVKLQEPITPKNGNKASEKYAKSSFVPKQSDKSKPSSQISGLSKYREFLIPNKNGINDQKMLNKSNPKINQNQSSLQYRKRDNFPQQKSSFKPNKANDNTFDGNKRNTQFASFANPNGRQYEPAKPFIFQHRFQTASNLSPPINNYNSPKGKSDPAWNSNNQICNVYASQSECPKEQPKWQSNFKDDRIKSGGGLDITIINNNVNNYISNITHNHIVKVEKEEQAPTTYQFKAFNRPTDHNTSVHSSNQFMKSSQKPKEKQYNIPIFLQQKKKTSNQWTEQSAELNEKMKSNNLSRKNTVSSNPSYQSPYHFSSQQNLDKLTNGQIGKEQMLMSFNLSKNNESSMSTNKITPFNVNSLYPLTPTPPLNSGQSFTSFHKNQSNFEFKFPLRTKTMQFYQKGKGVKNEDLQNKSFTQVDFVKNSNGNKTESLPVLIETKHQKIPDTIIKQQKIIESMTQAKVKQSQMAQQTQGKPIQKKLQFKKQLRNEFKDLLGGDTSQKQQQQVMTMLPLSKNDEKTEAKQCKQGNLKEKIKRKQIVFAQLKKEALKVLTDD